MAEALEPPKPGTGPDAAPEPGITPEPAAAAAVPAPTPEPGAPAVTPAPEQVAVLPAEEGGSGERRPELLTLIQSREKGHSRKFLAGAVAVVAVAVVALVGLVLLVSGKETKPAPFAVDGWAPVCERDLGCNTISQIAKHVSPRYLGPGGKSIVSIIPGPLTVGTGDGSQLPVTTLIEQNDRGAIITDTTTAEGTTVQFNQCGFAANCQLGGKPTKVRGDLLRRQALELALLTFHHEPDVDNVVVYMPPPAAAENPTYALLFRRAGLERQLARPLAATIGPQGALRSGQMGEARAQLIGDLTAPRLFTYQYQQMQQNQVALLLSPAAG